MSDPSACVFVPFDGKNPYQPALAAALGKLGVRVEGRRWKWRLLDVAKGMGIIHIHWTYGPANARLWKFAIGFPALAAQFLLLRLQGRRIVWTVHNLESHERRNPVRDRLVSKLIGRMAHAVIVHGQSAKQLVSRRFSIALDKVHVVPHGNYIGLYPDTIDRLDARRQLGIREDQRVVLFLGNIRPYKGVTELIKVFRDEPSPEAVLLLVGRTLNKEVEDHVRGEAEDDVRIRFHPGFVDDDRIQVFMAAADAVVFPYREVLTSGAIVLAMSFGKACIAPLLGCIPDVLDGTGAFLYNADDPKGLADALHSALSAPEQLPEMGRHNRLKAEQWSWNRIAAATLDVYRSGVPETSQTLVNHSSNT